MKRNTFLRVLIVGASLALGPLAGRAADLGAVKARMEQRQGTVDSLKERQLVGENNRGYLEARASLKPTEEQAMSDENADRRAVYEAIAGRSGTSIDEVGRARAQKIAILSKRGVWIQAPNGDWSQKS